MTGKRTSGSRIKKADVVLLLDQYQKYWSAARQKALFMYDMDKATSQKELDYEVDAAADALAPAQKLWINCTRHANSSDRWPLVTEQMIVDMLVSFKLWPKQYKRRTISELVWEEVWGDYGQVESAEWNRPAYKCYR